MHHIVPQKMSFFSSFSAPQNNSKVGRVNSDCFPSGYMRSTFFQYWVHTLSRLPPEQSDTVTSCHVTRLGQPSVCVWGIWRCGHKVDLHSQLASLRETLLSTPDYTPACCPLPLLLATCSLACRSAMRHNQTFVAAVKGPPIHQLMSYLSGLLSGALQEHPANILTW